MSDVQPQRTQEEVLDCAIRKHDLLYGRDHCDRKYILSCAMLPPLILDVPHDRGTA